MSFVKAHGFPKTINSVEDIIDIAREIGQTLLTMQPDVVAVHTKRNEPSKDIWVKAKPDGSSVTSSDIWANSEIEQRLKALPFDQKSIGIITEEGDKSANKRAAKKSASWVIDPLDNTGSYKRGNDDWSVTIGFHENGQPTGGVVYYPAQGKLYYTGDDGFAYMMNEKQGTLIKLTGPESKTSNITVMTDHDVKPEIGQNVIEKHAGHTERYWDITLKDGADIAEHGDLFYSWDIVAPAAIAARAGVIYLKRDGSPLDFLIAEDGHNDFEMPRNGFIAGNHETLKNIGFIKPESKPILGLLKNQGPV